jgi:hypothetical protein
MNYDKVGILIKFIEIVIKTDRNNSTDFFKSVSQAFFLKPISNVFNHAASSPKITTRALLTIS